MNTNNNYQAPTAEDDVLKIIRKCFEDERKGNKGAREEAKIALKEYLVKTDDGSYTFKSNLINEKSETMHTYHGAINESMEKFVKPSKLKGKGKVSVLDLCSGLGYNAASCIEFLDNDDEIEIDMVEISKETIAGALLIDNPIKSYEFIKVTVEDELYKEGYVGFKFHTKELSERLSINIYIKDAREVVKELKDKKYDAIFLDPFSPRMCPELYTLEFFLLLKNMLKDDGIILTYTSAAPVRSAMVRSGLHVGEGPQFGRKSGGTVAVKKSKIIKKSLSLEHERMIALSDAGIPFRDPKLNETSEKILLKREEERKSKRGFTKFASTVKTPLYLYKDLKEGRLKRRVLKNIKMLGIDDLKSPEAAFIVCPQFDECICGCGSRKIGNSKGRINEMINRLEIIIEKNNIILF